MGILMRVFLTSAIIAILFKFAVGTDHKVGAPDGGWDFSTDYKAWAASQKFVVGDTLTFTYLSPYHDVVEISEADYTTCSSSTPIKSYSGGLNTISLDTSGKRYFLCSVPGHCSVGMKIEIDTLSGSTPITPPPIMEPVAAPPRLPHDHSPAMPPPAVAPSSAPTPPEAATTSPVPSQASTPSSTPQASTPSSSPKSSPPAATSSPPSVTSLGPSPSPPSPAGKNTVQTSVAVGVGFVLVMLLQAL